MTDLCPYCGTPLKVTNLGRKFCPNCGIVDEGAAESENKERSYLG